MGWVLRKEGKGGAEVGEAVEGSWIRGGRNWIDDVVAGGRELELGDRGGREEYWRGAGKAGVSTTVACDF